jgi:hypothetical protein
MVHQLRIRVANKDMVHQIRIRSTKPGYGATY